MTVDSSGDAGEGAAVYSVIISVAVVVTEKPSDTYVVMKEGCSTTTVLLGMFPVTMLVLSCITTLVVIRVLVAGGGIAAGVVVGVSVKMIDTVVSELDESVIV